MHQIFLWKVAYLSKIKFSYILGGSFYDPKGPMEMNHIDGFGNLFKLSPGREQDIWKCIKRHWRGKRDRYLGRKDSKMPNSFRWPILAVIYMLSSFHITEYLAGHMMSHWRRKWQPTPVFLPEESQGRGSLVGCCLWGCTELNTTEVTQQHDVP